MSDTEQGAGDTEQGAGAADNDKTPSPLAEEQAPEHGPDTGAESGATEPANADTGTPAPSNLEGREAAAESQETSTVATGAGAFFRPGGNLEMGDPGSQPAPEGAELQEGAQPRGMEVEQRAQEPLPPQQAAQTGVPVKEGETVYTHGTKPEPAPRLEQRDETRPVRPEHWLDGEPKPGLQHAPTQ